jgi:TrpR family trp operon transcriptional repressor
MSEFSDFIDLIYSIRDKKLLEDFLLGVTTPSERKEFVQRIEIVRQLLSGKPQHDIARELGVGVATVTRASKELSQGRFKVLRDTQ